MPFVGRETREKSGVLNSVMKIVTHNCNTDFEVQNGNDNIIYLHMSFCQPERESFHGYFLTFSESAVDKFVDDPT